MMMAERDLECFLCQQHFTAMSGDLIILEQTICDDCITELEQLEGDTLRQRVSQHLAQRDLASSETEDRIVRRFESGQQGRLVKSMAEKSAWNTRSEPGRICPSDHFIPPSTGWRDTDSSILSPANRPTSTAATKGDISG